MSSRFFNFATEAKLILMMEEYEYKRSSIDPYAELLLDIGVTLLSSGAHCGRIESNVARFGSSFGISTDVLCSYSGLILTCQFSEGRKKRVTYHKRVSVYATHLGILNQVSLLSWKTKNEGLSYEEVYAEFESIKRLSGYPKWAVLLWVALASFGLCMAADGDWKNGVFAFLASFVGLSVRFYLDYKKFNPMISVISASFITTLIASIDMVYHIGSSPEKTMATAVLYLIPGVQLINCMLDFIEGHISPAISRGAAATLFLLCIAVGMSMSIFLIGLNNYN